MKILRCFGDLFLIVIAAVLSAVAMHVFVNPANFAPSGVDGISMMTQRLTNINMGYISLIINLPLLVLSWFKINKRYVVYTLIYILLSSVALVFMGKIEYYEYITENNLWISVFASGILLGIRTAIMIKVGGCTGGVDILASMVQKNRPYLNIETLITIFCYITIAISFFVYGNIESVIMSIIQMLIFNLVMGYILKSSRNAVEVKIITTNAQAFKEDILVNMKHGATVTDCRGMYTGTDKQMITTIINIHQMNDLIKLSRKYPDSFMYFGEVSGVWGNFRWKKTDSVK